MKRINEFDDLLNYIAKLGIVSDHGKCPGWIPIYQKEICELCDKVLIQSGQSSWYHKTFKPFQVRYDKSSKQFIIKQI